MPTASEPRIKRVLNVGSDPAVRRLHSAFAEEVRLDPNTKPDVVGSISTLTSLFPPQTFDAVWASHVLEHLYVHEVPLALSQVRTILRPEGFAVITSPDLEAAATMIVEQDLDHVAYISAAGPITVHDILFGHSPSIANGQRLLDVGFPTVLAKGDGFDLWAVALMEQADQTAIERQLATAGLDMSGYDQ